MKPITKSSGFTLMEMLVAIAIIGVLTSLLVVKIDSSRQKAKYARAAADLRQLHTVIDIMAFDTGEYPNHFSDNPCINESADNEIFLHECAAGLVCTDGGFSYWNGPYVPNAPRDPWGNNYLYDTDYTCFQNVHGCEKIPNGAEVRALVSFGPNGVGVNQYTEPDNQVFVICQE